MYEEIKAEIKRQQRKLTIISQSNNTELCRDAAIQNGTYEHLLSFIESLEKELPTIHPCEVCKVGIKSSTEEPQGLDEAATFSSIDYVDSIPDGGTDKHPWNDEDVETAYQNGFKAGAKWMAEQGTTIEAEIDETSLKNPFIPDIYLIGQPFNLGDKVIVQIRKKEKCYGREKRIL